MHPFSPDPHATLASLGETRLVEAIRGWLGTASPRSPAGIGDDCAVLSGSPRLQLVTVDPVIYGEHFDDTVPARGVGEKLFKRNLSDIAAMGGRPRAAVVALALDPSVRRDWLAAFYRGLAATARRFHVPVIGGDIARQKGGLVATLTLVGEATEDRPLLREGARVGDWIYVTGSLGGSILGHHWRFQPRLAEGAWLAQRPEVRCLMDVSDGLAKDLQALLPRQAQAAVLERAVPISRSARLLAARTGRSALEHALTDGEDYELLFAINARSEPAAFEAAWRKRFRLKLTRLGRFERAGTSRGTGCVDWSSLRGYEHLR